MPFRRAGYAALDWFIPNAARIERSEIGLARNFIATHLLGPFLIQSIVLSIYLADPQPGAACWVMMACVTMFWCLPIGLKLTRDLRLMSLISVELLCVTSLVGTSYYGRVNSPFLPWLLVSLMLGFFYLHDHALRVVVLFAFNIVATIVAHLVHTFPQHISPENLSAISWFSMFSATGYMSIMAIYYAGIITMSSQIERETERHRLLAQRLGQAKQLADTASRGKTVILTKTRREFEQPLQRIIATCQRLSDGGGEPVAWAAEIERIGAAGKHLLRLVRETVDLGRIDATAIDTIRDLPLEQALEQIAAATQPAAVARGHTLSVDTSTDPGSIRIDSGRLVSAFDKLIVKVAAMAQPGRMRLSVRRPRGSTGDWVEFRLRAPSARRLAAPVLRRTGPSPQADLSQVEQVLESSQMPFAALGGSLTCLDEPDGGLCFIIEVPARPVAEGPGGAE